MFMIDILRLPGVGEAREHLLEAHEDEERGLWLDQTLVDDLIRAVAEAVEKQHQNIPRNIPIDSPS